MRHWIRLTLLTTIALVSIVRPATATVIDFTKLNLTPQPDGTLQIGDLTIFGVSPDPLPFTPAPTSVAGVGLGFANVLGAATVDRTVTYGPCTVPACPNPVSSASDPALSVKVNGGIINSWTIRGYVNIINGPPMTDPGFRMQFYMGPPFANRFGGFGLPAGGAATFGGPQGVDFDWLTMIPTDIFANGLDAYLSANNYPAATISHGISLLAIDYTPASQPPPAQTPEPGVLALAGCGLVSLIWWKRRHADVGTGHSHGTLGPWIGGSPR